MRIADLFLLTALLVVALAWPLSSPPIGSHGEAREGLVVQDIVQHDRWVLPYRNGELPSKPPLFHWIAAGAGHAFGLSDLTVRAPSGLAAWVMALATYVLGMALGGRLTAWLAVGALAGMHGFWTSASEARVDMVFAACVTVALAGFFLWYRGRGRLARVVCYLGVASAVLAKGPAGAVIPGLVGLAFLAREHLRRGDVPRVEGSEAGATTLAAPYATAKNRSPMTPPGFWAVVRALWSWPLVCFVVAVDLGWYALAYRAGGDEFLAIQLLRENVERFAGRGDFGMHGGRSVLTMVLHLVTDIVPWNLALIWAASQWVRGVREDEGGRFLHAWWLAILAFFTVAYGKRDVYLLPLYPAIALLAGRALASALAGLTPDAPRVFGLVSVPAVVRRAFPRRPAVALVALAIVGFDLVLLGVGQTVREVSERRKSLVPFAHEIGRQLPADAALYAAASLSDTDLIVLAYRLKRAIPRGPSSVPSGPAPGPPATVQRVYVLVPGSALDGFAAGSFERVVVSRRRGVDVALVLLQPPVAGALTRGGAVS